MLNRTTQIGIAAMGLLAEVYREDRRLSSGEISADRRIPKPFVAKVLTILSHARLIEGTPGPGGGYRLSRPPSEISLKEIAVLFEREDILYRCPFGPGYCGNGPNCPLHDRIVELQNAIDRFLEGTTLAEFDHAASDSKPAR